MCVRVYATICACMWKPERLPSDVLSQVSSTLNFDIGSVTRLELVKQTVAGWPVSSIRFSGTGITGKAPWSVFNFTLLLF